MDHKDPIQEQLIAARRDQILDAAIQVFAEKGFHRATIRDIAKQAGIADGTIYNYFENKTALLLGILNRLNESERREADIAQSLDMDIETFSQTYMRQRFATLITGDTEIFRVLLPEILVNPELGDLYYRQIVAPTFAVAETYYQQWVEKGLVKPLDGALALRAISAMALGLVLLRLMGDVALQENWAALPDLLTEIIFNGIRATQGGDNATDNS